MRHTSHHRVPLIARAGTVAFMLAIVLAIVLTIVLTLVLAGLLTALPAEAQCVMCYKNVAGAGTRTIDVIKVGIYIMLIPTLFIFGALGLMVFRRRQSPFQESVLVSLPGDPLPELPGPPQPVSR